MARLEHIGIAVTTPEPVRALLAQLLGQRPYKEETVRQEGVRTHFLATDTAKLELLEPLAEDSAVGRFLARRGEGLHHLAFEVDDVFAEWERLVGLGFTPLGDAPRHGADEKLIFFLHPKETHGVLVEFCQSMPAPPAQTRVPFRGEHLAAYRAGDPSRPAVLILHGAGGSTGLETAPLLRQLEPYFHVLALDFPGHGASAELPEVPLDADLFADSIRVVLDHFDVPSTHLFGFSMGGYAALHFAHRHPGRVDRLALHATSVFWDDFLVEVMLARLGTPPAGPDAGGQDPGGQDPGGQDPGEDAPAHRNVARWRRLHHRLAAFFRRLPEGPLRRADLQAMDAPTLLTAGDRDDLFPLEQTLDLYRTLPDSTLAVLPGVRHALPLSRLEPYRDLLRQHFAILDFDA